SQLESGQHNNTPAEFNVQNKLETITEGYIAQYASKDLTLQLDAAPARVYADPSQFEQVVSNLLNNAFKFTPDHGSVTIRTKTTGELCAITVQDTGPGVPASHLEDIFDKFTKLDDSGAIP